MWTNYVEVFPASRIVCNYVLPSGVNASAVTALALDVNYRGPSKNTMTWTFEVFDTGTGTWTLLGDNAFAAGWVWTKTTFTPPAPLARFFASGTLQIRYGTTSSADASDIDQLLIRATVGGGTGAGGTTGAAGTMGRGGTTGAAGTIGRGGTTGAAGTTGAGGSAGTGGGNTPFSMACSSLSVVAGQIGPGQNAGALTNAELTGTTDVWENYVELFPAS